MLSSHCHNNRLCKSLSSLAVTSLFDFRLICCILAILLQLYPSNCGNEAAPSHSQTGVTALTALFLFAWLQFSEHFLWDLLVHFLQESHNSGESLCQHSLHRNPESWICGYFSSRWENSNHLERTAPHSRKHFIDISNNCLIELTLSEVKVNHKQ